MKLEEAQKGEVKLEMGLGEEVETSGPEAEASRRLDVASQEYDGAEVCAVEDVET